MKEPGAMYIPYSQLSVWQLKKIVSGNVSSNLSFLEFPEIFDPDFRRRYAAILLKERGK